MKTLGDGQEMTVEDAQIILENSRCTYQNTTDHSPDVLIDGVYSKTEFVAIGVLAGWIDGKTFKVTQ